MTLTQDDLAFILQNVSGWLAVEEAYALYKLASEVPDGGNIVEIGSYHGRSTIALALGARESHAVVYAIDPHHIHEAGGYFFGPDDLRVFMQNILSAGVAEQIRLINVPSEYGDLAIPVMKYDLVFIDGAHEYEEVCGDFEVYGASVKSGAIAIHDSTGAWEGPTQVVKEALHDGWILADTVVNMSILRRVS